MGPRKDESARKHRPEPPIFGPSYAAYARQVQQALWSFGVPASDLEDLSQEVFLIVMAKQQSLEQVVHMDLWLREISRKVAAGYRRRAGRTRAIAAEESLEAVADGAPTQASAFEAREDSLRLQRAIDALDEEARDLIALHQLGGLPLVNVAELVERDPKTVRKRLEEANRRLTRLLREHEHPGGAPRGWSPPPAVPIATTGDRTRTRVARVLGQNADITVGLVESMLVAVWPGPPSLAALRLLDEHMSRTAEQLGSGLVYLSVVESTTSTPTLEARQKITYMLRQHSKNYGVYPHVLLGGFSWIARPIMAGLALLAGIPAAMPFFGSTERAAHWLLSGYMRSSQMNALALVDAVNELRAAAVRV